MPSASPFNKRAAIRRLQHLLREPPGSRPVRARNLARAVASAVAAAGLLIGLYVSTRFAALG